ncbi:MAG TPA: hypothetical protein VHL80_18675 [Polyangia bacterium]|nr:hypothetical protein [Polyangia bacterium]
MKTNSTILALVSALSLAGTAGAAQAQEASAAAPTRGSVAVQAQAARAVVAGPVAMHAYSQFSGATVYVVASVTGTDADCAGARQGATRLGADRAQTLTVGAGQLACVETTAARGSEVLWHAQAERAPAPTMLARR